jgi:hypothetical protein
MNARELAQKLYKENPLMFFKSEGYIMSVKNYMDILCFANNIEEPTNEDEAVKILMPFAQDVLDQKDGCRWCK